MSGELTGGTGNQEVGAQEILVSACGVQAWNWLDKHNETLGGMPILQLVFWVLMSAAAVVFVVYVTYLFVHRLRRGEAPLKSFRVWLLDLFDIASGLG